MALAPRTVRNMPDCFRRDPATDLQPASITPEPANNPFWRNSGYLAVVECSVLLTANAASRFFRSRSRTMIQTGSSKHTPHPSAWPESRKAIGILQSLLLPRHSSIMPFSRGLAAVGPLPGGIGRHVAGSKPGFFTHTIPRRPFNSLRPPYAIPRPAHWRRSEFECFRPDSNRESYPNRES
jgi:hypothetical protein